MAEKIVLVLTTWPNGESARLAARTLVEERLVACANIVPGIESIYRWREAVEESAEVLMLLKTTAARYSAAADRIRELHTYEVPEVICVRIGDGLPAYLKWVAGSCAT